MIVINRKVTPIGDMFIYCFFREITKNVDSFPVFLLEVELIYENFNITHIFERLTNINVDCFWVKNNGFGVKQTSRFNKRRHALLIYQ